MRVLGALVVCAVGCFGPDYTSEALPCTPTLSCPVGQSCSERGLCETGATSTYAGLMGVGVFGEPTRIAELDDGVSRDDPTLTADQLELYYNEKEKVRSISRPSVSAPWGGPELRDDLDIPSAAENNPEISADGLSIWFTANDDETGQTEVYTSVRATRGGDWPPPVLVPELSDIAGAVNSATPTPDGLTIIVVANADSDDLFIATRSDIAASWSSPEPIAELNTGLRERAPFPISADSLLFVSDSRLALSARDSGAFGPLSRIPELNIGGIETDPWLSPDGKHIVFVSDLDGGGGIYEAFRD